MSGSVRLLVLLLALALIGCAQSRMIPTQTVHNPDATRIWIVHEYNGVERVLLCDAQMLKEAHVLCVAWPQ